MKSIIPHNSLKFNMFLNAIKSALSIVFPLITFPYISRVLGVESIGKYNFSNSVISYFILIAGLGVKTYAIREGAKVRYDRIKASIFINQMFTINCISTILSYVILAFIIVFVPTLHRYISLLLVLSIQIAFSTIGVDWIYSIFENFLYITMTGIIFNTISIFLLFIFVKDQNDVVNYALITVFAGVGSNLINYIYARTHYRLRLTTNVEWRKHLKPIITFFAMQIATTIFVSSDTTMLGFMWDDNIVGIYAVSSKVYTIIKTVLASVIIVSIPRLSSIIGNGNQDDFSKTTYDIYATLLTFVIPAILGILMLRREVVVLISGENYVDAVSSLAILAIALIFSLGAWFWGQAILVPMNEERYVFRVTILCAFVNIGLNFFLIPIWKENAAAITTLIAECIAFVMQRGRGRKYVHLESLNKVIVKVGCGCIGIIAVYGLTKMLNCGNSVYLCITIILSILVYLIVEILLKNDSISFITERIKS